MAAPRFYLTSSRWLEERPLLDPADSHHCADVLRLGVGDRVVIFDGRGNEAEATLLEVSRKQTRLSIGNRASTHRPRCQITLAQGIPKARNMDLIIQKAVELGASSIEPLLSERTVVRLEGAGDGVRKQQRWQAIAVEACKQCGQNWMPSVGIPRTTREFLGTPPGVDLMLIASLQPEARPMKEVIGAFAAIHGRLPKSLVIMVGPEGDFSPEETALAKSSGTVTVTLGPITLRTETAALYCLSVLGHELF